MNNSKLRSFTNRDRHGKSSCMNRAAIVFVLAAVLAPAVALLHDVLHHIENPAAYIKSLAKYLKPAARIVIVDYLAKQGPHRDDASLQVGKEDAAKLMATIGFKPVDDLALFPDKYFVIYGR